MWTFLLGLVVGAVVIIVLAGIGVTRILDSGYWGPRF